MPSQYGWTQYGYVELDDELVGAEEFYADLEEVNWYETVSLDELEDLETLDRATGVRYTPDSDWSSKPGLQAIRGLYE